MGSDVPANDVTLATYEAAAQRYRDAEEPITTVLARFLDDLARRVGADATVLEIGSGTGRDARYLEARGVRVIRTDATKAFVQMMREDGHDARLLDVRTDHLGGPFDAVYAGAMLLHLDRHDFAAVLANANAAVVEHGILAFTIKEGDGEEWSNAKLGMPRRFTYWREPEIRDIAADTGWSVISIARALDEGQAWLLVLVQAAEPRQRSVVITVEDPRTPDVRELISIHQALSHAITPDGFAHVLGLEGLIDPAITLFAARRDGALLGVGALRELDPRHGELKSMHTRDTARRQGIARTMVQHLLAVAADRGYDRVSLETGDGPAFAPAHALYGSMGFAVCAPFGEHIDSPHGTCMTIDITRKT